MSAEREYSHLCTKSMKPCFQLKEAHAEAMRTTLCPACAHPRPGATAVGPGGVNVSGTVYGSIYTGGPTDDPAEALRIYRQVLLAGSAHLPLRGDVVPLHWREGRCLRIVRDDAGVTIEHPPLAGEASLRRALRAFYEAEARADVGRWLPTYLPGLPRPPRRR